MDVQAFVDLADVKAHRVQAEREAVGAALVAMAFGEQMEHLEFASGELRFLNSGGRELLEHQNYTAGDLWRHRRAARVQLPDGFEEAGGHHVLEHVAAGARAQRVEDELILAVDGEYQDRQFGALGTDLSNELDAGYPW